jgi:hypothetical protein
MIPRLCFCFLATLAVFAASGQRADAQVVIELRLLRPDSRGVDENVRDEKVWMLPSSGTPAVQTTGTDGRARFQLSPTAYVKLRIGNPPYQIQLYQMSGRYSQSTSAYMNAAYGFGGERMLSELEEFVDELSTAFRNRDVPDSVRTELSSIKEELMRATEPQTNGGVENQRRLEIRARAGRQIDGMLNRRNWRIGVFCNYTEDGAVVTGVNANSPAARAGIRVGQCITNVDGQRVGLVDGRTVTLPDVFQPSTNGNVRISVMERSRDASSIRLLQIQLE